MKTLRWSVLFCAVLVGCSTSPTGRKQLHLMSSSQLEKMGFQSFAEMKAQTPASRDRDKIQITECVTKALLVRNGLRPTEWELVVFKDDALNAFALPGRKIGVYEGIFKAAQTPDQLAAVIGHEIGHVLAEHANERVSQQLLIQGALSAADVALDSSTPTGKAVLAGLGLGANVGIALPFSRKHELEADLLGLRMMAKAGFDPAEGVRLWQNMASAAGKESSEWLSTHPSSGTRIQQIQNELPKLPITEPRTVCP